MSGLVRQGVWEEWRKTCGGLMQTTAKIPIGNKTRRPRTVWVEPWAEDFGQLPE